jgi:outer membrane immunogenic protein
LTDASALSAASLQKGKFGMKRIVIALGVTVASTTMGSAADLPARVYTKAPAAVVYDWTGFYIGANAGIGVSRDPATMAIAATVAGGTSSVVGETGAVGGGQVGYNWQGGNLVLGAEADIQGAALRTNRTCTITCVENETATYDQHLDWFGTVRGRVGLATGSVLGYVTGGLAYGDVTTENRLTVGQTVPFSWHQTRTGWTAGGGVEAALAGNWTGKIEYLYVDLGSQSGTLSFPGLANVSSSIDYREHIVRAGVNYRFGEQRSVVSEPLANWRGFYVGGNIGSAVALNPGSFSATATGTTLWDEKYNLSPKGFIGGGQLGYNWQAGSFVYGLETDLQGMTARNGGACLTICEPGFFTANLEQRLNWFGTTRGRIGYATGSSLFYVTGGLAYGDISTRVSEIVPSLPTVDTSLSHTKAGYTVGGGIETKFDPFGLFGHNWSAKTEYLYIDFGTITDRYLIGSALFDLDHTLTTHVQEHVFRTGLNYHFNGTSY